MYKKNDKVLIRSPAGDIIPLVEVILIEQTTYGWMCKLTKEEDINMLKKQWGIPFRYPDKVDTFVFESNIIKKVKKPRRRKSRPNPKRKTI